MEPRVAQQLLDRPTSVQAESEADLVLRTESLLEAGVNHDNFHESPKPV